jgi:hypothetical protein
VFVAWDEAGERRLRAAGVPFRVAAEILGPDGADAVDEAAIAWTKDWGRQPLTAGLSFRDRLEWKGVSLWWFAELYLHHSTAAPGRVRTIETLHRLFDALSPQEVAVGGLADADAVLVERTCAARAVLFDGPRPRVRRPGVRSVLRRSRWNEAKLLATALKARVAGPPAGCERTRRSVLFLSHAAFWRRRDGDAEAADYEHYFDRLIPAVDGDPELVPFVLAVGPRSAFRRRGPRARLREWLGLDGDGPYVHVQRYVDAHVVGEVRRATARIRSEWRALAGKAAVRETFRHRGVSFGDLSEEDFAETMLLQLPWAVRSYEEMAAALRAERPAVVCLYAESSGWGRAALAACRAAGVPTVALQHGILYPRYYSYRHDPDEGDCPRPDTTAVFGDEARRLLTGPGGYDPASLVITGSPKFDGLLEAARGWDRAVVRERLGVAAGERLVVVASRFRGIRSTHQSIGSAFPALVAAVERLGLRCIVKPHPAEEEGAYVAVLESARAARTRVVVPSTDLLPLLHAADLLVTVESLSAVEALVLGCPVVVLNMPTNLRALVESGAALGVAAGEAPDDALRSALFDEPTRTALAQARARYLSDVAHGVDGGATTRVLDLLKQAARRGQAPAPGVVA